MAGTTPQTIGDVIALKQQTASRVAQAKQAAAAADQAYADAQSADAQSDAELKTDLAAVGPTYVQLADGSIEVYIPDASAAGYHVITPAPASTALHGGASPSPTPTPTPEPTPPPERAAEPSPSPTEPPAPLA